VNDQEAGRTKKQKKGKKEDMRDSQKAYSKAMVTEFGKHKHGFVNYQ
jgi:hypothetical protein